MTDRITSAAFQPEARVIQGDALAVLRTLEAESVHCVVTSPPYWSLRDYGTGTWEGGDAECDHKGPPKRTQAGFNERYFGRPAAASDKQGELTTAYGDTCGKCGATRIDKQLGLESTPQEYVANIVEVFREVRRVLRPDGTLWLNIGDSYVAGPTGHQDISKANGKAADMFAKGGRYRVDNLRKDAAKAREWGGLKPKDKCMIPARVAIALQDDGWYLRQEIVWCKKAPMPESTRDRPTTAHEMVYLFSKQPRYFYDQEAEKVPAVRPGDIQTFGGEKGRNYIPEPSDPNFRNGKEQWGRTVQTGLNGRNLWSYWLLSPDPYSEAHFAVYPRELARRCISLGTSAYGCCSQCQAPWARVVERSGGTIGKGWNDHTADLTEGRQAKYSGGLEGEAKRNGYKREDKGWAPTCTHSAPVQSCTILDPFSGAGTTGVVAVGLGRRYLGIELSAEYVAMSERRIAQTQPALPGLAV